ncbi:uncharacterized protein LOC118435886 [Folsomia candida]|uniref:uncharacterized protein LOC118435886 n=1 Tax=Folsomia candida TaxID=158441 RepID=UPI00160553FF|nr:uncharacterized protein LOC118435886 [Folsomia candida]
MKQSTYTIKFTTVFFICFSLYLILYQFHFKNETSTLTDLPPPLADTGIKVLTSMLNLPAWYRLKDWGLKKDPAYDNVTITTRGYDQEELTAWNEFFFGTGAGLMLELGAMNGLNSSVSLFFEQTAHWRSILIEANPTLSSQIHKNRPDAISFNAAICDQVRTVHYKDEDITRILKLLRFSASLFRIF